MGNWFALALRTDVIRRSRKVALLVGTILVLINYGDRLFTGAIGPHEIIKILMTYCVPYCVSTYAAVSAIMEAEKSQKEEKSE